MKKLCDFLLLGLLLLISHLSTAIRVFVDYKKRSYHLEAKDGTLLLGSTISVFAEGRWCVQGAPEHDSSKVWSMTLEQTKRLHGNDEVLGIFSGVSLTWNCILQHNKSLPLVTDFRSFNETAVVLDLNFPEGAQQTNFDDSKASMTNFPTLVLPTNYSYLSWQGSFIQSTRGLSEGPQGGPTLFYKQSSDSIDVIVASPWIDFQFPKAFTAGSNKDFRGRPAWAPGTSARIYNLPPGYTQSFVFYEGTGITATLYEWGRVMQQSFPGKLEDVTLTNIGYQTDNGAAYCFCQDANCSETLISEMVDLEENGLPMKYLSFQGAGTSSGRGQAAPWCVQTWGVDGGLDPHHYPLSVSDLQKAIDIPMQLYSPYFCPTTNYFDNGSWSAVKSDPSLSGCQNFDFRNVAPEQSKAFYGWYMDKGIDAGMKSFETDFMNQNYNCVPDFINSAQNGDVWLQGMADAALERDITIQWCYATPTDLLASIRMPAVTQFRVSFDFCYGRSWDIGESSLLVWALGAAPSKDTLWTSDNGKLETPGCSWTLDHEDPAAELHLILALMSTGPVGISDSLGYTNFAMAQRAVRSDGVLLKPSKAITAIDSSFLEDQQSSYLYSTTGLGPSWIFVSFLSDDVMVISKRDFWPPLPADADLVHRDFHFNSKCTRASDAVTSGCVSGILSQSELDTPNFTISTAPRKKSSPYVPTISYVWQNCVKSKWFFLGELSKYVPLSPSRFQKLTCTTSGVSTVLLGVSEERVELTALEPQQDGNYKVVVVEVVVPKTGIIQVAFGPQSDAMTN